MSHELLRLKSSLYNVPHLITQAEFDVVEKFLETRNETNMVAVKPKAACKKKKSGMDGDCPEHDNEDESDDCTPFTPDDGSTSTDFESGGGVAVINIHGALTYRPVQTLCGDGGTNYKDLVDQFHDAAEEGYKTIVLDINSCGGEAYSCFSQANLARQIATDNNITVYAYVDGTAASAAYAWTSIADEIVAHPQSEVGSIGVVVSLMNNSGALEMEGYKRTFISAGASKVPYDAEGQFKPEFLADIQSKVDVLYEQFVDHVATNLNVSPEVIRGTEAKVFLAEDAMQYGLVDRVMTQNEFASYVKAQKEENMLSFFKKKPNATAQAVAPKQEVKMEKETELAGAVASADLPEAITAVAEASHTAALLAAALAEAAEAKAALASLQESQAQSKANARKTELAAVIGETSLDATFQAVAGLDDAAFAVVLSGFKAANVVQAKSEMFTEVAGVAEASSVAQVEESAEMAILRAKYSKSE